MGTPFSLTWHVFAEQKYMKNNEGRRVRASGTNSKLAGVREIVHVLVMKLDLWAHPSEPRTNESIH